MILERLVLTMAKTMNYNDEEKEIRKEIKDYLRTFAITYAKEAAKGLTETAAYAIAEFYKDYTPRYYDRTEDLLNNSYRYYYKDNGRRVYGGVRIDAEKMSPYMNNWNGGSTAPEIIAESAWVHGWHGHSNVGISPMKPTPLEIVMEKMIDEKFLSDLNKKATQAANSKSYKHLNFI